MVPFLLDHCADDVVLGDVRYVGSRPIQLGRFDYDGSELVLVDRIGSIPKTKQPNN